MKSRFSLSIGVLTTLTAGALIACSASEGGADSTDEALTVTSCAASDQALFFHGLAGYGKEMRRPGICVPDIANFDSDVAFIAAPSAKTVTGYSAGRKPLLHRLQRGEDKIKLAIMLDGSWADGPRFDGQTGPEIVSEWMAAGSDRKFVLVYLPDSAGWSEYAELTTNEQLKARVRVCPSSGVHADLPTKVGPSLVLDTNKWLSANCASGGGAFPADADRRTDAGTSGPPEGQSH